ncbi:MAG: hypothetical protein KBT09_03100 [Bacteroidales bacterium]|nr:hypothetical protein [Candidatus Sodaliphilus fimicaballi]
MKHRFIKTLAIALPLGLLLILGLKFSTLYYLSSQLDYSMPHNSKVLLLGNSQGRNSINDSILTGWTNRCIDAEMYSGVYLAAERMLEQNKVDTLIVHMIDFYSYPDNSISTNMLIYKSERIAIADNELLSRLWKLDGSMMVSFYLLNDLHVLTVPATIGGYEAWDFHFLRKEMKQLNSRLKRRGVVHTPRPSLEAYSMQISYLEKIIDLCKAKGVQLVLMNYPKYKRNVFYERSKSWDYYLSIDSCVRIADYEYFQFPDSTYYANSIHLNYRGAEYFSNHLKTHGLKTMTPAQWRKTRND